MFKATCMIISYNESNESFESLLGILGVLDRIKRVLFFGNFYIDSFKILLKNFFLIYKKTVTDHLFVSLFRDKKSK